MKRKCEALWISYGRSKSWYHYLQMLRCTSVISLYFRIIPFLTLKPGLMSEFCDMVLKLWTGAIDSAWTYKPVCLADAILHLNLHSLGLFPCTTVDLEMLLFCFQLMWFWWTSDIHLIRIPAIIWQKLWSTFSPWCVPSVGHAGCLSLVLLHFKTIQRWHWPCSTLLRLTFLCLRNCSRQVQFYAIEFPLSSLPAQEFIQVSHQFVTHLVQAVFPLQLVRGNYNRLQRALSELRQFFSEGAPTDPKAPGCLPQGIQDAVAMFRKQTQSLLQVILIFFSGGGQVMVGQSSQF